ncbi:DUF1801 domain-containing protein [Aquibium carbonis]|uniref:DUF1801 domain-containing protein n=1 Tax=Aquibium carbonis TaxID=2495581 RepID=A0A429YW73_9HYPH|nr:DUF1801 domain-containing protein [Aquibium carbonis]RST85689.1 DUF1801 domain-containing protein [Aquibium carbonis]
MAETFESVDTYLEALPELPRTIMVRIRELIASVAPGAQEAIRYGMPTALLDGASIVYYAAWKRHVGLYPVYRGSPDYEEKIAPWRDWKDTVRFPLETEVPYDVIELIVTAQVARLRQERDPA